MRTGFDKKTNQMSALLASRLSILAVILLLSVLTIFAQSYSIDWYKISGGGGTSTGAGYAVSGTIGQPDASSAMTGLVTGTNYYSITGGFWSLYAVQTPGAPTLFISHSGNAVTVYWQNVTGWNLIQSGNLATSIGNWPASGGVTTSNGTNSIIINNPAGNLFFRLKQ